MLSSGNKRMRANPVHANEVLAPERFSDVAKHLGRGLFFFLFLALEGVEAHRLVCAKRVNVSAGIHETSVRDGGSVVDDLIQGVFFLGLGGVEDVDKTIGTRRQEESWMPWMKLETCDGICV